MSKWVLALVALAAGAVHSWDLATTTGKQIDFYTKGNKTHSIVGLQFHNLTASAYDAVHDLLLVVDQQTDNASVYSFNFSSNEFQSLVTRKEIESIAYDPVKDFLFWVQERSIYWMPLSPGSENETGNLLIKLDDEIPSSIAVDSCGGFIYWTNKKLTKSTIEKARFDGSERVVVLDKDLHEPHRLVIDPQIQKMFWIDIRHNDEYFYRIRGTDLNGKNKEAFLHGSNVPNSLTVSNKYIYFIERQKKALWRDSKYNTAAVLYTIGGFYTEFPSSVVAKYTIEEQTQGIHKCEALTSLLHDNSVNNDSLHIPSDFDSFCVNGKKANDTSLCKCTPGYIGERCDVSVCQNYCIQGNCRVSDEGEPYCGCHPGYSGARCEVNMCLNYCLNNGVCFVTEENEPACQCVENYNGSRCDAVKNATCTVSVKYNSGNKNLTLVELLSNQRKVAGEITVNFELESK